MGTIFPLASRPFKMKINLILASLFLSGCSFVSPLQNPTVNFYEVSSFDVYQDNDTLHALISGLKTPNAKSQTIRYLHSNDNGKNWSSPVDIESPAPLASRGNDVQIAANGENLIAVWQIQGEMPNYGALFSVYSHDFGKTWHAGKNPAVDNSGDQSHADLIVDKNGVFHAVWLADPDENGYQSLRYARSTDNGENWQLPLKLDDSSCSCCSNTLAISPDTKLHVLYRDMNPRDMMLLSSSDGGTTWNSKKTVGEFDWHFDGCPHVGGGLAFDENNTFYASVWTGVAEKSGLYTVDSLTNTPIKISRNATHSDIATLENKIIVVWDERSKEGTGIFSAESFDKGQNWSTPRRLSKNGTNSTHPRIVTNENKALILWTEKQSKHATQWAMTELE